MSTPTVVDLFAGCGGGSLGFMAAGFDVVGAVEIDALSAAAFKANTGYAPTVEDICAVTDLQVDGELTLLFGCPPCQSFTELRRGDEVRALDPVRNRLPDEYLRIVEQLLPRHVAFENVPGMAYGRWAGEFTRLIERLQALGYALSWDVLNAADFGVPQRRRRLVVVGSRVSVPRLPEPTHGAGRKAHKTVGEAIGHLRPLQPGEVDPGDPLHRARRHSSVTIERLRAIPEGGGRLDLPEQLQLKCHRGHDGHRDVLGRMRMDSVAPTLTTGCTNVTRGRFAHPCQDRAITVREALLLQGFPSDAVVLGGVEAMSTQIGNAVPPILAEQIGAEIVTMENASRELA